MVTKADLRERVDALQEMCDAAAEALTDPELEDREARIEAIDHLRFRAPAFLGEEEADEDEWDDDDD